MLIVSELHIYPVKSLAGIAIDTAAVTSRGFQHDRRLVLVDAANRCLTQRELPELALLQPVLTGDGLHIHHKRNAIDPLFIPQRPIGNKTITVTVWDDDCEGQLHETAAHNWFSRALGLDCRLVYMPDSTRRQVDERYALNQEIVSFADAYPMLIISQSSLDDLNERLVQPIPMNRFRPNIVFTGGEPFLEDQLQTFTINGIEFSSVKPCARCNIPTINQDDISTSKEPLKTLAGYRQKNNKILFGQNLLHKGTGSISIGDTICVKSRQAPAI